MIISIKLFIVLLFLPSLSFAASFNCNLPVGLYQKRLKIVEKYTKEVGHYYLKNKDIADKLSAEKQIIDLYYRNIMIFFSNALKEKDYLSVTSCCTKVKNDPVAFQICNLFSYLFLENKDNKNFIDTFPSSKEEVSILWILDEIAYKKSKIMNSEIPSAFLSKEPTLQYIDALFQIAKSNNSKAIDKYFNLINYAGGYFAEYIYAQIIKMFVDYPQIIIDNWQLIKKYRKRFRFVGVKYYISSNDTIVIKQNFNNICNNKEDICEEILDLFK